MPQHDVTLLVISKLLEKIHDALAKVQGHAEQNTERIDILMQAHADLVTHAEKQHAFVAGSMEGFWERLDEIDKRLDETDKRFASFDVEQCPLRERVDEIERQLPPEVVAIEASERS